MNLFKKLFPILPYLFVFLFALYVPIDPDLGWHLKNGEYFFQHGRILRDNIFSTLMPDYQWANTSWLTDIITYGIYAIGGFFGLTILGGIIVASTFYFFSKIAKLSMWDQVFLFPLILYLLQPINQVSFRGQQLSLLLIGILFYIFSLYPKHKKVLYWTIPLFLLWVNLHGQFIFGFALFALWIFLYVVGQSFSSSNEKKESKNISKIDMSLRQAQARFIANRKEALHLLLVFVLSLFVTLINPFGWNIHLTALSHFGSPLLQYIAEYLPFEMLSTSWWNQVMAGVLLAFGFLVLLMRNNVLNNLPLLGAGIIVFLFSFGVRRYAWPAYYLILPLLAPLSAYLKPDSKKLTATLAAVFAVVLVGIGIAARYPYTQFTTYSWDTYCQQTKCSPKAAEYIIDNKLTNNLYTLYGWGGWLIWEYPQIKPVIDGRMHLWTQNGYSGFEDYYAYEQNFKDIDESDYNTVLIDPTRPLHDRLIKLENAGKWKMVYHDANASVFVRK